MSKSDMWFIVANMWLATAMIVGGSKLAWYSAMAMAVFSITAMLVT